jgi:hypothetical protein
MAAEDLSNASARAADLEDGKTLALKLLTIEQREMLSKTLFPDTHNDSVDIFGKSRALRPLPIKWSKQVHAMLRPFHEAVESRGVTDQDQDFEKLEEIQTEADLVRLLLNVSGVIADFYQWADVKEAIQTEDILIEDLQALVVRQTNLQNTNDFLLTGLRVLVGVMQQAEIQSVKYQNMFSGLS